MNSLILWIIWQPYGGLNSSFSLIRLKLIRLNLFLQFRGALLGGD
jgi:hypothetical protein